jgi:hypothetical protein
MLFWALAIVGGAIAWMIYECAHAPLYPDDYGED